MALNLGRATCVIPFGFDGGSGARFDIGAGVNSDFFICGGVGTSTLGISADSVG